MHRFFVSRQRLFDGQCVIEGDDHFHLSKVLRGRPGEMIVVVDEQGTEYGVEISTLTSERTTGNIKWQRPNQNEPELQLHLIQAIAKEGMDEIIDAATVLGVTAIWPVITERVIAKPPINSHEHKQKRWQTIAQRAAALSHRGQIPQIMPIRPLPEALPELPQNTRLVSCVLEGTTGSLAGFSVNASAPLAICVGPEGDFGPNDLTTLEKSNSEMAHLGPRVMRTRLAAIAACTMVMANAKELEHMVRRSF